MSDGKWSELRALVKSELAPLTEEIDRQGLYPEALLRRFGEFGLFSAHVDGTPASGGLFDAISGMAVVAEQCLSTGFTTWCQDACGWYVANSDNAILRTSWLADIASGGRLAGTGLSNPMKAFGGIENHRLSGRKAEGGYIVSGVLSWVSNLGPDHVFGALFRVEGSENTVMALVRCDQDGVTIDQRNHFCALEGTRTLVVQLRQVFIGKDQILADPAEPYLMRITPGFILLQAGMALGLLKGAINVMRRADSNHGHVNVFLPERPEHFEEALEQLTSAVKKLAATPFENDRDYMRALLSARLSAAEWCLKATNAAMLHAGTLGYLANGEAQRRLRESYFIAIVTPSIKHLRKELHDIENGNGCMAKWRELSRRTVVVPAN